MFTHALQIPTLTIEHPGERVAVRILAALVALLVVLYIYLIASSTFHIIARKEAEVQGIQTQSALAQINAEYYALSASITQEKAITLGLAPLASTGYITRSAKLGLATTHGR